MGEEGSGGGGDGDEEFVAQSVQELPVPVGGLLPFGEEDGVSGEVSHA